MKKKATMLIQHLEAVYTMYPKRNTIKHHAFIAVYHDRILKIGSGTGREFTDKDTRIIEGRNHIALPGFIDIDVRSEALKQQTSDTPYQLQSLSGTLLRHGTMLIHNETVLSEVKEQLRHPSMIDVHTKSYQSKAEICRPLTMKHDLYDNKKPFCISCGYHSEPCLDQWLCAKLYAKQHDISDLTHVLAACTLYPARALGLNDYGILKQGGKANILLFSGKELSQVMKRFYGDELIHVIKDGIRFYPNPII